MLFMNEASYTSCLFVFADLESFGFFELESEPYVCQKGLRMEDDTFFLVYSDYITLLAPSRDDISFVASSLNSLYDVPNSESLDLSLEAKTDWEKDQSGQLEAVYLLQKLLPSEIWDAKF